MTDNDDDLGAVVAMLRALLSGDDEGGDLLLSSLEGDELRGALAMTLGVAVRLGVAAYGGADAFADTLGRWTPGARIGDPPALS